MESTDHSPLDTSTKRWRLKLIVFGVFAAISLGLGGYARGDGPTQKRYAPAVTLGARLFKDDRFSAPNGDFRNSCKSCHLLDEDPQGLRAHAEFLNRSWVPWRSEDPRRAAARNAPTLFDVASMPRLHFDGEFSSLEELVKGTLGGRPMGWLPGEKDQAFDRIYGVIMNRIAGLDQRESSYRDQFKKVYGIELEKLGRDDVVKWVATAISDYLRSLKSDPTSPWDRFVQTNALDSRPRAGEDAKAFARRLLARVADLEAKRELKLPKGFDALAMQGLKVFFRAEGAASAGNCAACHVPPLFTDFSFHNTGVSQSEYETFHGEGSFAAFKIPDAAAAIRPSAQFRETASARKPGDADLGYWNFVDVAASPLRRAGETDDQFLRRMIATFKTPTLRNLAFSNPYMHNGEFTTLESALAEVARLSALARAGRVRAADEELGNIRIGEADIPALAAFLNTLNEDLKPAGRAR